MIAFDRKRIGKALAPVLSRGGGPGGRVVYAILSHDDPDGLVRLVRTIRSGSPAAPIVVHHDFTRTPLQPSRFEGLDRFHLLGSTGPTRWGHWSLAATMLLLFEWVEGNLDYDWVVLLSGRDYPLKPLAQIERDLTAAPWDAFVGIEGEVEDHEQSAYWRRYFWRQVEAPRWLDRVLSDPRRPNRRRRWLRWLDGWPQRLVWWRGAEGSLRLAARLDRAPFDDRVRCFKGSAWPDLSRIAIRSLLAFWRRERELMAWMHHTRTPDEAVCQIAVMADPGLRVCRDEPRFMLWDPGSAHPRILRLADLDAALASGRGFARKLDASVDAGLLDALDARLRTSG